MCKQCFYTFLLTCTILHIISAASEGSKPYAAVNEHPAKVNSSAIDNPKESKSNFSEKAGNYIVAEGGKIPSNEGREPVETLTSSSTTTQAVLEKNVRNVTAPSLIHKASHTDNETAFLNSFISEAQKPVTESSEVVGDSKVKPRKGVDFNTLNSSANTSANSTTIKDSAAAQPSTSTTTTTTKATTTKFVPHKPKVTVGSDEEGPPPRLFINGKEILPKNTSTANKKNVMDDENVIITNRRVDKGSYYVLPIVLTILAVPLLAIILTVVYKRGSEWWQHRHYRRMDFLIDGMYNN